MVPWEVDCVNSIVDTLAAYDIDGYLAETNPQYGDNITEKIQRNIESSDVVLALYSRSGSDSSFVNQEIAWGLAKGKRCIVMKEPGVPLTGFIHGAEVIEYDPYNPQNAIAEFVNFAVPQKASKDAWGGLVKAGLVIGGGILLYHLLKGGDDDGDYEYD
jgi:hypothetical protein